MMLVTQAVILAGGTGTRLQPFTKTAPKPMYPVEGKPFLEYLVAQIKIFGITEIVMLLGYLPEKIMDYFGDGSSLGVHIQYHVTPVEADTGARLKAARHLLQKHILLMYCDNYCPIQWDNALARYRQQRPKLQISAYTNKDGYTRNNLQIAENGLVQRYDKERKSADLNGVDIGYILMQSSLVDLLGKGNVSFERELYGKLVEQGQMYAFVTPHRYYSVGSWERIALTEAFFKHKKVVFLDRDGTLNQRAPKAHYIMNPEEFCWLDGAKEAVKLLKEKGYTIFLVTNQPGIARGQISFAQLEQIHQKMLKELRQAGGDLDKIYICPHGWDEGCDCRKPKPGMLYQAQKEFSLDLTKSFLIGDDERDIMAGEAAGCTCLLVDGEHCLLDLVMKLP